MLLASAMHPCRLALILFCTSAAAVDRSGRDDGKLREPCLLDLGSASGQHWQICWPDTRYGGCESTMAGISAQVPGTVLASMLISNFSNMDPYVSGNLRQIPDIHAVGREFYTVIYRTRIAATDLACAREKRLLLLRGVNYFARVSIDGREVANITGMFRRQQLSVPTSSFQLDILVEPPWHPGVSTTTGAPDCPWKYCGQGGDHSLAMDGPIAQFALGWDWVQATPDRNTGLWDKVELLHYDGVHVKDVYVRTNVCRQLEGAYAEENASIVRSVDVWLQVEAAAGGVGLRWQVRDGDTGQLVKNVSGTLRVPSDRGVGALFPQATLWMPWQHGAPKLYSLEVIGQDGTLLHSQYFGIRCAQVVYDVQTDGPAFRVNGQSLFLAGANWITTDQLLRFSTDAQRYEDEVRLMRRAGANIIRVWGGGLAERPEFFSACDRLGMLVYQEFWMTGDNNGPQAGEYSWPLDHSVYIDNVRDTVLLLRGHPSLLWWGGGNELWPSSLSPPSDINEATRRFVEEFDGSRPYIQTSALLQQMRTYNPKEVHAALSVNDGPYGALAPHEFFERNPQLRYTLYANRTGIDMFPLSINPEMGGPNWPTFSGLAKFIRTSEAPSRKGTRVPDDFTYHTFQSFNIDMTVNRPNDTNNYNRTLVDPIYDLFGDNRITLDLHRYTWRANLVQYVQYQLMFEGYLQHQWSWYAGLILWKGQSPWPALRGFVYDWYLEPNSAHAGMRAALHSLDHVQVDLGSCDASGAVQLSRVNRGWEAVAASKFRVTFHSLPTGDVIFAQNCSSPPIGPNSVSDLECPLHWPNSEGALLLRLTHGSDTHPKLEERILSDPCNTDALIPGLDFRNLDESPMRLRVRHLHPCKDDHCHAERMLSPNATTEERGQVQFLAQRRPEPGDAHSVQVTNDGSQVALLVHLRLFHYETKVEVLPVWWSADYFSLLPGESRAVSWRGVAGSVVATGFNVEENSKGIQK